jgi:hypothetical protein
MRADPAVVERVMRSYELMLDFYGMRLVNHDTGLLDRSLPPRNFVARYRNLVRKLMISLLLCDTHVIAFLGSTHNNLRISRIMKHLDELGLSHLLASFLLHVLSEQSEHGELNSHALVSSMDRWWANCLRNDKERSWVNEQIAAVRNGNLTFTREMYEQALQRRQDTGSFQESIEV